ncbi:hypothetical protein [Streptomyces sp. NPDC097619]|uniref:hypothetical protein n=1 Tax=Streptomyces sp. NPDC097619 TaxID=3157228 RepID=UPI00332876AA
MPLLALAALAVLAVIALGVLFGSVDSPGKDTPSSPAVQPSEKPQVTATGTTPGADDSATGATAAGTDAGTATPVGPGTADVRITSCEVDDLTKWPGAALTVTNRSSKPSDYLVSVEFLAPDGVRLAEGHAVLNRVAPGQVAKETARGLTQIKVPITCRITNVSRTASL